MDENFNLPLIGEKRNALVISDTDSSRLQDALRIFQGNSFIVSDSSIAVRYTLDNMQVLRNMGYKPSDTPSDRKSTRLNSSHIPLSRMPSSA